MNTELIISTMNKESIKSLNIEGKDNNLKCLIINQCDNGNIVYDGNVRMINSNEIGLSKSRNKGIDNAEGDICIIGDDDVKYVEGFEKLVIDEFRKNPKADIITFQVKTPEGDFFKNYKDSSFKHDRRSVLKVSSIEVAFKLESIKNNNIRFDEMFGLGAKYVSGEENIFLTDCLKKGINITYVPTTIAIHPKESSGKKLDERGILSKGALFYRLFGFKSIILNLLFIAKKYKEININKLKAVYLIYKGTAKYVFIDRIK